MADELNNGNSVVETSVETPVPTNSEGTNVAESAPVQKDDAAPFNRPALEAKIEESLKTFREIGDPDPESSEPVTVEADPEPGDKPADETAEKTETEPDTETETQEQPPEAKKPSGPILPDAYRRSLKAYDWTDDEIDKAFKANPLEFTVTAQKLHANRNKETSQWAELGRASRANQPQPEAQPKANPYIDPKTGGFKPLDVKAMTERYGNEELIAEIAAPVNAILEQVNAILPDLMSGIRTVQSSKTEQLAKQIDDFFGGKELTPFAEAYGKDTATLTEPQIESRNKVLEMADALVAGAKQQGRKLSVNEALLMAHDHVSSGLKVQTIRKQIQTSVQKRAAGLTLRPSAGGKADSGPPKSRSDLEAKTRARLAAAFGA